jgi:hypothetical protein
MSNTYTFRQIAYITIEVVADTEDEAYDKMCDIDPLTGDIDYEEPELESIEDVNGKRLWDMYKGEMV